VIIRPLSGLTRLERLTALQTLSAAFEQDAHFQWLYPPQSRGNQGLMPLFDLLVARGLSRDAAIAHNQDFTAIALFEPPQSKALTWGQMIRFAWGLCRLMRSARVVSRLWGLNLSKLARPVFAHMYLQNIGVQPSVQGSGWGTAMVEALRGQFGCPIFVETCMLKNLAFYEHLGFRTMGNAALPDGPVIYRLMDGELL
jgi:GNAT superfamily N-acetyltransferase